MKRFLSLILVGFLAFFGFVACTEETTVAETTAAETTTEAELTYEIALVTDVGNIDDKSFNEGAWNGVVQYADENSVTYAYYRPTEDSETARISAIESAINKGAKIVVCPGYLFETAIYSVQDTFPNVSFLLLDGTPNNGDWGPATGPTWSTSSNVHNVLYQEEQSGFLAGYAAVKEGYTDLGFAGGMAVPAVVRFGYGFVQGAEYAADEMNLTAGDVTIEYYYANAFAPSPELETKMDLWFAGGMEVIFACGGKLYQSVVNAAEATQNGKVIGVDVDQYFVSDRVISSAMKGLQVSVYDSLTAFYDNSMVWPTAYAGQTAVLGATTGGVGLPTATTSWGFTTFTTAEYDAIFA
jgi:basic membrane protein A